MLGLQIVERTQSDEDMIIADWTYRVASLTMSNGARGNQTLSGFTPLHIAEAFEFYSRTRLLYARLVNEAGRVVWRGRLENQRLSVAGVEFEAFGHWNACSDVLYTALWSATDYRLWDQIEYGENAGFSPSLYNINNNGQLFIAPLENANFVSNATFGGISFETPDQGRRGIVEISFDYEQVLPANWTAHLYEYARDLTGTPTSAWSLASTGSSQTGSATVSITTNQNRIAFVLVPGATGSYTGDPAKNYLIVSNIRIKTTSASTVTSTAVVKDGLAAVRSLNSNALQSSTMLIEDVTIDERDLVYEDVTVADVLEEQAQIGDGTATPDIMEVGVEEDKYLFFRQRGSEKRVWHCDLIDLDLNRSFDALVNSAYGRYKNEFGQLRRTATSTDSFSLSKYGLTRQDYTRSKTSDIGQAIGQRNQLLNELSDIVPDTRLVISPPFTPHGAPVPAWEMAPWRGDEILLRNLPPTVDAEIGRIRQMRILEVRIDLLTGDLEVTLEYEAPDQTAMIAEALIIARAALDAVEDV